MSVNPVCWFEIYVDNIERARKFYESVFQLKLERLNSPSEHSDMELWAFPMEMDRWGAGGALVKMSGMSPGGNSTLVYFACDDCAVEASRVAQAGGRIQQEKMSIGEYGFIALAFDTEGNMFGMHSRPAPCGQEA